LQRQAVHQPPAELASQVQEPPLERRQPPRLLQAQQFLLARRKLPPPPALRRQAGQLALHADQLGPARFSLLLQPVRRGPVGQVVGGFRPSPLQQYLPRAHAPFLLPALASLPTTAILKAIPLFPRSRRVTPPSAQEGLRCWRTKPCIAYYSCCCRCRCCW